jgi:hypothetical protein
MSQNNPSWVELWPWYNRLQRVYIYVAHICGLAIGRRYGAGRRGLIVLSRPYVHTHTYDRVLYVDVCVMMLGCLGYQGRVISIIKFEIPALCRIKQTNEIQLTTRVLVLHLSALIDSR